MLWNARRVGQGYVAVILSLVGYFTSRPFSRYLLVPSAMKIATSRGLLRWLAGRAGWPPFWAALRPRSKRAQRVCVPVVCALHCGYMEQNSSELPACRRENTCTRAHRVAIDVAEFSNGPMVHVAVGHARLNNKSIHCLNHSGGDNHRKRTARCGNRAPLNKRHLC